VTQEVSIYKIYPLYKRVDKLVITSGEVQHSAKYADFSLHVIYKIRNKFNID